MSWEDKLDKILTKEELKEALPVENVLFEELGVVIDAEGRGTCPFHDDTRPSFGVFEAGDGYRRAGCWSCDWRGDIFDIIIQSRECSFSEAIRIAREMFMRLGEVRRTPTPALKPTVARETLQLAVVQAWERAGGDGSEPIQNFIRAKGLPFGRDYLRLGWRVGVDSTIGIGSICIPHCDRDGWVTAYKVRTPYTPTIAARGSKFDNLYGIWRDGGSKPIILVEGESDAWFTQHVMREYTVLGLPTGAQTPIRAEWLTYLQHRNVTLCFDGDTAGYQASVRWARALGACTIIKLDEGKDCVSTGTDLRSRILGG